MHSREVREIADRKTTEDIRGCLFPLLFGVWTSVVGLAAELGGWSALGILVLITLPAVARLILRRVRRQERRAIWWVYTLGLIIGPGRFIRESYEAPFWVHLVIGAAVAGLLGWVALRIYEHFLEQRAA